MLSLSYILVSSDPNPVDGSVEILTNEFSLDGEQWRIPLRRTAPIASPVQELDYTLVIDFIDVCWTSVLGDPSLISPLLPKLTIDLHVETLAQIQRFSETVDCG
jgi:hypothetical protein